MAKHWRLVDAILNNDNIEYIHDVHDTGDEVQATSILTGVLGVNITYEGKYRTLSNAHILTQFDPKNIGNMIQFRHSSSTPFINLFPVTGQVAVTYYTNQNQPNPTVNIMDIAWGDVTESALVSRTIKAVGGVTFQPSGKVRKPNAGEEFMLGNYRFYKSNNKITSVIKRYKSKGYDSSGGTIYSFWKNGITYANPGLGNGDSGTAMVATSDKAVIGLHRASSASTGYGCPIV